MLKTHKQLALKERATLFSNLIREPGWELLQRSFRPEMRTRITDADARESFLYEAIRAQVIQEIFSTPLLIIQQAEREWARHPVSDTAAPDAEDSAS
ncbi:MAG: hypothetical protein K0Q50_2153 [Vampirovibrio sp.]|jgi:hypothetical protein|nr:hypothetical protein [Vampirovibrio sp.]